MLKERYSCINIQEWSREKSKLKKILNSFIQVANFKKKRMLALYHCTLYIVKVAIDYGTETCFVSLQYHLC